MISIAAESLGVSRFTIYAYRDRHPRVREVLEAERHKFVDTAELGLYSAVLKGEPWAIALVVKTLGRDRGYVEGHTIEHSGSVGVIKTWKDIDDLGIPRQQVIDETLRLLAAASEPEKDDDNQ